MITFNYNQSNELTVVPSEMAWSLNAVNAANSGRTANGYMYSNRVTQKRKLELTFAGVEWQTASQILNAVNAEYLYVRYPDMLTGAMRTMQCYVGDKETTVYTWWNGQKILTSLKFNLIER